MKLQIRVDEQGVISDVKFKTFGCGSAIASSSYMTERVKGLSLEEAGKIKNTEIAKELALPPVKLHCSSAFILPSTVLRSMLTLFSQCWQRMLSDLQFGITRRSVRSSRTRSRRASLMSRKVQLLGKPSRPHIRGARRNDALLLRFLLPHQHLVTHSHVIYAQKHQ